MKLHYFLLLLAITLVACETEKERHQRLKAQLDELQRQLARLQNRDSLLEKEQQKCWSSTAKERFAFLEKYEEGKEMEVADQLYIKKVLFSKIKDGEYKVLLKLKPIKDLRPHFRVYLYNSKGLIISDFYHKKPLLFGKIKQGQTVEKEGVFKNVGEIPSYFRVEVL